MGFGADVVLLMRTIFAILPLCHKTITKYLEARLMWPRMSTASAALEAIA